MKSKSKCWNHLWHMKNTEENRQLIKTLNKSMKAHDSRHRLYIKYRKPIEGEKYGWGGSLACKNARTFAVYLKYTKAYYDMVTDYNRRSYETRIQKDRAKDNIIERARIEAANIIDNCDYLIETLERGRYV